MKPIILFLLVFHLSAQAQTVDAVKSTDPNPTYDTNTYVDMQLGDARIDNDIYASEFQEQNHVKFVDFNRQELPDFHFIRGVLTEAETGKTAEIYEGGEISQECTNLLTNASGTIFYLEIEYLNPDGEYYHNKSKFLVKEDSRE